jgi:hypothetical protein
MSEVVGCRAQQLPDVSDKVRETCSACLAVGSLSGAPPDKKQIRNPLPGLFLADETCCCRVVGVQWSLSLKEIGGDDDGIANQDQSQDGQLEPLEWSETAVQSRVSPGFRHRDGNDH